MKITQDVRDYAKEHGLDTKKALEVGMQEQSDEFQRKGSEIYHKA
jgi:phosphomethylpyrimidine synthase